ncbi:hypothetical protein [Burkholderia sp. 3C]
MAIPAHRRREKPMPESAHSLFKPATDMSVFPGFAREIADAARENITLFATIGSHMKMAGSPNDCRPS